MRARPAHKPKRNSNTSRRQVCLLFQWHEHNFRQHWRKLSLTPFWFEESGTTHMRTFVLRARAAPTDSQKLLASVGKEAHSEILAHTLMNAIFVAQSHRADVTVYLVLDAS